MGTVTSFPLETTEVAFTGTGDIVCETDAVLTNPVVGTQSSSNNTTRAASTAFVQGEISNHVKMFSVHKNGTDQTGIADSTATTVTWSTEAVDNGNHFASNAWTPPAGRVRMEVIMSVSGTISSGATLVAAIRKNGSIVIQSNTPAGSAGSGSVFVTLNDVAIGTDAYDVQAFADVTSGTATVSGLTTQSRFFGIWLGA